MTLLVSQSVAMEHTTSTQKWTRKVLGQGLNWKLWGGDRVWHSHPHPGLRLCFGGAHVSHTTLSSAPQSLAMQGHAGGRGVGGGVPESHAWGREGGGLLCLLVLFSCPV